MQLAVVVLDGHLVGGHAVHDAGVLAEQHHAAVVSGFVFHAGAHDGSFRHQQRHGLTLHVGAHQRAVGVVVLQEGDHGSGHGNHLLGRHVDVVHVGGGHFHNFVAPAHGDAVVYEGVIGVQGLFGLTHVVVVFLVGGHVDDLVRHLAGFLVHLAVGRFDEAILVDAGIGGQRADQTDVGTFRGLNGADTGIVGIVHVAHFHAGTVAVQTAGAQSAQAALVGQLRQGVGLIHELGQLGGAEELLNGGADGTNVDQVVGLDVVGVLNGHALAHHALQAGQADAHLVLQQFAHAAQAAVAQMVDVVGDAHAVRQAQQIADGGGDVIHNDVLGHNVVNVFLHGPLDLFGIGEALDGSHQGGQMGKLIDARFLGVKGQEAAGIHKVVAQHADHMILALQVHHVNAGVLDVQRLAAADGFASPHQHLAAAGVDDVLGSHLAADTGGNAQLLIKFIAAHTHEVIALGIEEQVVQQRACAVLGGRLAGLLALVDFDEALGLRLGAVAVGQGGKQALVLAQQTDDIAVAAIAQGAQQHGDGQLAGAVNAHPQAVVGVGFVLQPGAAVGDDLRGEQLFARLVHRHGIIRAGRANQLAHDDALGAVDHKGTVLGHQREIAHEDLSLLDLAGFFILKADKHLERRGVRQIALTAALDGVLGLGIQRIIHELQNQVAAVVHDRGHVGQHFPQVFLQELAVGILLHLDQVGHVQHFVDTGKAHALAMLSHLNLMHHKKQSPLYCCSVYRWCERRHFRIVLFLYFLQNLHTEKVAISYCTNTSAIIEFNIQKSQCQGWFFENFPFFRPFQNLIIL